eukprot:COSAG01_NODE_5146_length_4453_cov_10.678916_1_plen_594_part_00
MKAVARQVREQTKGNQRTWEHSCLRETVTLMPGETEAAAMAREKSRARTAQIEAQQTQLQKLEEELHVLSLDSLPQPEPGSPSESQTEISFLSEFEPEPESTKDDTAVLEPAVKQSTADARAVAGRGHTDKGQDSLEGNAVRSQTSSATKPSSAIDAVESRRASTQRRRAPSLNLPGRWDTMISYTQRNPISETLAVKLSGEFRRRKLDVWLDVEMARRDEAAMREGVEESRCVVAVVSGPPGSDNAYFRRDFCLSELRWAHAAAIPVVPVVTAEDKSRITEFFDDIPEDLAHLKSVNWEHVDRKDVDYFQLGVDKIMRAAGIDRQSTLNRFSSAPTVIQLRTRRLSPGVSPVSSPGSSPERRRPPSAINHDVCSWIAASARSDPPPHAEPCLRQLLQECGAEQYLPAFCAHGFRTKQDVSFVHEHHLEKLGLDMAARCKLLARIDDVVKPPAAELELKYPGSLPPDAREEPGRTELEQLLAPSIRALVTRELRRQVRSAKQATAADQIGTPDRIHVLRRDASEEVWRQLATGSQTSTSPGRSCGAPPPVCHPCASPSHRPLHIASAATAASSSAFAAATTIIRVRCCTTGGH